MPEQPSDEDMPLDGTVGGFHGPQIRPVTSEDPAALHVAVFGDTASGPQVMGLADDVSLLIQAFVRDPASVGREARGLARPPDADPDRSLHVALHETALAGLPARPRNGARVAARRPDAP